MKTLILAILSVCFSTAFSQNIAYYPSGKKIPFRLTSINAMKDSLKIADIELVTTPYGTVVYKLFTNTPVFIIFDKKDDITKIPQMLKKFNYSEYLYSYHYYFGLNTYLEEGKLTKDFLIDTFGKPDGWTENAGDTITNWRYRRKNLYVEFNDSVATKVDVTNFRAFDAYGMAITNYDVTGEEYSIGFDITLMNLFPSKKTIKYIFFTVTAKNPVKDIVGTKTVKGIGPIKYLYPADYVFENVFYSNTASSLVINSIKVQFMDGSFKLLTRSQIDAIIVKNWKEIGEETLE